MATFSGFQINVLFDAGTDEIDPNILMDMPGVRIIEVRSVQPGGTKIGELDDNDRELQAFFEPRIRAMVDEFFGKEVKWDVPYHFNFGSK